jgi:hypothetical protein
MSHSLFGIDVDWSTIKDVGFQPLPPGNYAAKISSSELRPTKDGTGSYVRVELTLMGGKGVKGRKVIDMFNIKNKNENTVMIGLRNFKKLSELLNKNPDDMKDTSELVGEVVGVNLRVDPDKGFGEQNKVKNYMEFSDDLLNTTSDNDSF